MSGDLEYMYSQIQANLYLDKWRSKERDNASKSMQNDIKRMVLNKP